MGDVGSLHWLTENWFLLLSAVGITGGLFFNAHTRRSDTKTRRITNLISLTEGHREIWKEFFENPHLARVVDPNANAPAKAEEEVFVNLVIQHTNAVFHAMRDGLTINPEGLRRDVWWFFSLPIPRAVWEKLRVFQNDKFAAYVEACRNWK